MSPEEGPRFSLLRETNGASKLASNSDYVSSAQDELKKKEPSPCRLREGATSPLWFELADVDRAFLLIHWECLQGRFR